MAKEIAVTIDGKSIDIAEGQTILQAARQAGIQIPTLCFHPDLQVRANCRLCVVEVEGMRGLQASCTVQAREGMVIRTNTPDVRQARMVNIGLILSDHPQDCLGCVRNLTCELQNLTQSLGVRAFEKAQSFTRSQGRGVKDAPLPIDDLSPSVVRDPNKCILCRRCVEVCHDVQGVGAIGPVRRGFDTQIAPAHGQSLADSPCVYCGQCIVKCPVGALYEKDSTAAVWDAINDPSKLVVVQVAPAVRVSIGEELGPPFTRSLFGNRVKGLPRFANHGNNGELPAGTNLEGQLVAALRRLGFDKVFDATFAADLTIMEEGSELVQRLARGSELPLMTSCCPGWVRFAETFYPEILPNLSTCKSPQQMLGALAKTYYAEKAGMDPAQIVVVSVMPCTAKKAEALRPELRSSGYQDVDHVITTRELGRMLRQTGIRLDLLAAEPFDDPLGIATGAGIIFGATGGVMEAALRTAHHLVTGRELEKIDVAPVRGLEGVRRATIDIDATRVEVAVAHGLRQARAIAEQIVTGRAKYDFVEVMACPGGCVGGGGQPMGGDSGIVAQRVAALYAQDKGKKLRRSHENPAIQQIYAEYLGEPLSRRSHHLLHTHYAPRQFASVASETSKSKAA